ncbi:MAG: ATP phosphoribosyltransferase [Chloroflexota bacterium]|nr:ATP phosphoribosyltransferase [Chloroflexota bacterium]
MLSHPPTDSAAQLLTPENDQTQVLTIALAKGRLTEKTLTWLDHAGLPKPLDDAGRKLVIASADGSMRFIMAKPADVPIYVEYGAADLGICGLDVLREGGRSVYEPLLLPFGYCRLSLAGPADRPDIPLRYDSQPRVATTFPRLTADFFRTRGINAEIIALKGSVELGPLVGLADLIVDLVDTGNTLRANGLIELRVIMHSQAVLIANRAAYRLKAEAVQHAIHSLRTAIDRHQSEHIAP